MELRGYGGIPSPWCQDSTPSKKYCVDCKIWGDHGSCDEALCPIYKKFVKESEAERIFY